MHAAFVFACANFLSAGWLVPQNCGKTRIL
jgi:hypothetical protein